MPIVERARRVLLVDDHPGLLTTSSDLLREEGFAVEWCGDADSALQRLAEGEMGVVVLDLGLPGMSGLELLTHCRAQHPHCACIIYTAQADFDAARRALNLGAAALVEKSSGPEALIEAVHRVSEGLLQHRNERCKDVAGNARESHATQILEVLGDGVLCCDAEGRIDYLNAVAESLLGATRKQLLGAPLADVYRLVDEADEALSSAVQHCLTYAERCRSREYPVLCRDDGARIAVEESASPLFDDNGELSGVALVFRDASRARASFARAHHEAAHDPLTGLVNRREFERRLLRARQRARHDDVCSALLYLDLDRFKQVNDSCGHSAGDELLSQIAQVLQRNVRSRDTLARLGGDEFGMLLEGCGEEQAEQIAGMVLRAVADYRFLWEGRQFCLGASIGLARVCADQDGNDGDIGGLLKRADRACYAAKEAGRNRVVSAERLAADGGAVQVSPGYDEQLLYDALARERLCLAAQPIRPLRGGVPPMVELYARLRGDDGAPIPPGAFIPVAERYQLMPRIDRQMITLACRWLSAQAPHDAENPLCAALNLSAQTLYDERFADFVSSEFARHELPLSTVCFEVRESDAVANLDATYRLMSTLQARGARWALDDFGSGLGAIRLLKHLPVQLLKLDGSLVRDLCCDGIDRALLRSLVGVARELELHTVAKHVVGGAVLAQICGLGIDYAQGEALHETGLLTTI